MKKQLSPSQTLWIFGALAFLTFVLSVFTFVNFRQAFGINSDVPVPPEDEITSKPTLLEHGVNISKTGRAKVVVSEEQTDILAEEQSPMTENTALAMDTAHQPEEKAPAKAIRNSVEVRNDKMDVVKPAGDETQNKEIIIPSDKNTVSKPLVSTNVQKQSAVILTANATPAKPLPSLGGNAYGMFPECRVYHVNSQNTELKDIYEKIDSLSALATFYDTDETKFNLLQSEADKGITYNMIVWDGYITIKKAATYKFILTWVVPFTNEHDTEGSTILQVKDKVVLIGPTRSGNTCQGILDIDLKAGMNRLRLCILTRENMNQLKPSTPVIRYKPMIVITDFREISIADLLHTVKEVDW